MSKARSPNYSWDTGVFIASFTAEASAPLADLSLIAEEIDTGKAVLTISTILIAELTMTKATREQRDSIDRFLRRSNVNIVDVTIDIARLAGELRKWGELQQPVRKVKTPDAIVIATASIHNVDALHALDNRMLRLNGHGPVSTLRISKPVPFGQQRGLF